MYSSCHFYIVHEIVMDTVKKVLKQAHVKMIFFKVRRKKQVFF